MSATIRAGAPALMLVGLLLAGCAADGSDNIFTTGALGTDPKVDPQCVALATRIEALRKEGIGDKIEKAAAKKYKMTQSDLAKADMLTKANAEFQGRCSTVTPDPVTASPTPTPPPPTTTKAAPKPKAASAAPTPQPTN